MKNNFGGGGYLSSAKLRGGGGVPDQYQVQEEVMEGVCVQGTPVPLPSPHPPKKKCPAPGGRPGR